MAQSKRNVSIQLMRIVAMFMIVMDHTLYYCVFPLKPIVIQLTNSAVFIFLFISGYLFGKKNITNWKNWFIKRGARILIPFWVIIVIDFVVENIFWHNLTLKEAVIYTFNLQGIFGTRFSLTPVWFLTLLMICYIITPLLNWLKKTRISRGLIAASVVLYCIAQILCSYLFDFGMVFGHTVGWCLLAVGVYSVAFFIGDKLITDEINIKKLLIITVSVIVVEAILLAVHSPIDGTKTGQLLSWYGFLIIDLWIIIIFNATGKTKIVISCKTMINFFDGISYEFYLVHSLIITLMISLLREYINMKIYILLVIIFSILGALAIKYLSKPIIKLIDRKCIKE